LCGDALLQSAPVTGQCRVVCYHPDHSRTMAHMTTGEIAAVIDLWAEEYAQLAARPDIASVVIFENRGAMMGASSPHPHGQIWATSVVPVEAQREDDHQLAWRARHGRPLLLDYLTHEIARGERVVLENDSFVVVTPFWAAWPFETLLAPRRPVGALAGLAPSERRDLADVLKRLTTRYDNLFQTPCPYTFGWHQALTDGRDQSHAVMHAHFYPPLLRSATIRKHMVGFEMLAMAQRDLTPEDAAARLRALPDVHYSHR
jgi:UDPglucose--hexose-1-phosphate uridylyltransferase